MPQPFPTDRVPDEVRARLAADLGSTDVTLLAATEARLPSGEAVRVVDAAAPGAPNVVRRLTFTDAGDIRPVEEVERLAGRRLFVPDLTPGHIRPDVRREPVRIEPRTNDWRLDRCQRAVETVTVTIPPTGATPKADVYLLADTTGSMAGILAAVQAGASGILNHPGLAGFDVAWGIGNYRDFPVGAGFSSYAFAHQLAPTTVHADADTAIAAWAADEGFDLPEGQLFALDRLAVDPGIGWRADSRRIVVWFGDAPGHDPICPELSGLPSAVTEASVTAALQAAGITVVAVSTMSGAPDALDGDPTLGSSDYGTCAAGGTPGQATRITAATGGTHTSGIDTDTIATTLGDLVAAAVASTGSVSLVPTGDAAAFVESITPPAYGPLPGDEEHVLQFEVTWLGVRACLEREQVFTGTLDVVADGVVVAAKSVRVTVPPCRYHYVVEMLCGVEKEDREDCHPVVPGRYATTVTITNPTTCTATIEKHLALLVVEGDVIGREPDVQDGRLFARIELGPHQATMDDCCALREVVGRVDGLLVATLDVISDVPLAVSAVHTSDRGERGGLTLTTRSVEPRRAP
ncbi:hypothetical protein [Cellulomonas sp.]|uniref:hypothetical protein n=1 Tax=Cellulomonas sp. TaxID=40001 RepID=UPI0028118329|nr:hypothetical protein [Cellulomonas sp.]